MLTKQIIFKTIFITDADDQLSVVTGVKFTLNS